MKFLHLLAWCAALGLAACGKASTPPASRAPAEPPDPQLARLYDQTCKGCHGSGSSGAPVAGDQEQWGPRLAQGQKVLLDHVIHGFKGMPPMGSCADCSEPEFAALIAFMSGAPR